MNLTNTKNIKITEHMKELIIIEDDEVDLMTIQRALKELGKSINIKHFEHGLDAINYLKSSEENVSRVILLDLNTPVMNGIEFLEARLKNPDLTIIPVVVMTTSKNDSDKLKCYQNFASSYFVKPVEYPEFVKIIDLLTNYWDSVELVN